jgi:hypothetical protein
VTLPLPVAPPEAVSQLPVLEALALHVHPSCVVTWNVPPPAAAGIVADAGASV